MNLEVVVHKMLPRLPHKLRQQLPKLSIFEHQISETALLKITQFDEALWKRLLVEPTVDKLVEKKELRPDLTIIEIRKEFRTLVGEGLKQDEYASLQKRYCEYYFKLSRIIATNQHKSSIYSLAIEEMKNLEQALRLVYEEGRWNTAILFALNLVHLQKRSSSLTSLIEIISLSSGSVELEQARKRRSVTFTPYSQKIENLRARFGTSAIRVPWQLLAGSNDLFADIMIYFKTLQNKNHHIRYDLDRLYKIHSLQPDTIYIGLEEFEGYVVFYFQKPHTAVLDCPIIGHAIYVIRGDWTRLSMLSKRELLTLYPDKTRKIVHAGKWFERVMESLYGWKAL